ncbi:MAG: nuclear transport factor 2 family protein [Acidobacteriota bacterium]|nr:nuclear transport factor 2 family protein [Acidobacteriota bacterium]
MRRFTIRLFVAFTTFVIGVTATNLPPTFRFALSSSGQVDQELLDVESNYLKAHLRRDAALLDRVLADDFTFTAYGRRVIGKAGRLALVESPDFTFVSINTDEVKVRVSGDTATVSGQAVVEGRYKDRDWVSPRFRFTRDYEKRDGVWKIVAVRVGRV